ncbi:hypothetical protein [Streptomyces sp. CBMA152]|uniref:hypothetical protein n=1 Tax=Streptomyces sp. CBMA152 TaxID=1896312 RepID=UPI0016611172|nr:hypothetical protein [Streptomyces sp. CBMA152]
MGIHKFVNGEPVPPDLNMVFEVLAPYDAAPERATGNPRNFWIRAADGSEAEVFVDDAVITVERPQGGDVFRIVAELADRLGAAARVGDDVEPTVAARAPDGAGGGGRGLSRAGHGVFLSEAVGELGARPAWGERGDDQVKVSSS